MGRSLVPCALLIACGGVTIDGVVVENGDVPGVAAVSWTAAQSGTGRVVLTSEDQTLTTPSTVPGTEHELTLLGIRAGVTYNGVVEYTPEGGEMEVSEPFEVTTLSVPSGTPVLRLGTPDAAEKTCTEDGYFLFSWVDNGNDRSGVTILDRGGRVVWTHTNDIDGVRVSRTKPSRDGQTLLWNYADTRQAEDLSGLIRMSLTGDELSNTRTLNGHHDFIEHEDGRICWLGYDFQDQVVEGRGDEAIPVAVDTLHCDDEGASDTSNTETLFNVFTDYAPGVYDVGPDMDLGSFLDGYHEFSHGNSLVYLPHDDTYLIMFRWLDSMVKVNASGEVVWEFGGRDNDLDGAPEDLFLHSHMSDAWDGGMLVFDNHDEPFVGPDQEPPSEAFDDRSRLVEYAIDDEGLTFEQVWEYQHDSHIPVLGDVRRMPIEGCDNLLVSFSSQGRIVELTREGEVAWSASTAGLGVITSRVFFLPSLYDFGGLID